MSLSDKRKKFKEDLGYALGKFNWGQSALDAKAITILNEWRKNLDNQDKEFIKELKDKFKDGMLIEGGSIKEIIDKIFGKELI